MLLALTHGMQYGAKRTTISALGNVTITLIQAFVSIAGLGTILVASESIFQLIKYAGAGYLIYMGIKFLFFSKKIQLHNEIKNGNKKSSLRNMYMQAAFVTAGNPKAIIFFTAVFPQFIDYNKSFVSQSSILLSICAIIAFICFMIYALGGQKIMFLFSKGKVWQYVKRVIGCSFIGAGIGLALSSK